jgi:hypothetical protein
MVLMKIDRLSTPQSKFEGLVFPQSRVHFFDPAVQQIPERRGRCRAKATVSLTDAGEIGFAMNCDA